MLAQATIIPKQSFLQDNFSNSQIFDPDFATLSQLTYDIVYNDGFNYEELIYFAESQTINVEGFNVTYGILNNTPNVAVLAFRGMVMMGLSNFHSNVDDSLVVLTDEIGAPCQDFCMVHNGFYNLFNENFKYKISTEFSKFLTLNRQLPQDKRINILYISGHSIGGTLATLAAYQVSSFFKANNISDVKIILVTLGTPRVGNNSFKDYMDKEMYYSIRVTYDNDNVVSVPMLEEYVHLGSEIRFSNGQNYAIQSKFADINNRNGFVRNVYPKLMNIFFHLEYNKISPEKLKESLLTASKSLLIKSD